MDLSLTKYCTIWIKTKQKKIPEPGSLPYCCIAFKWPFPPHPQSYVTKHKRFLFFCSLTFSKVFSHGHEAQQTCPVIGQPPIFPSQTHGEPLQKQNIKRQWTSGSVTLAEGPQCCEFNSLTFTAYVWFYAISVKNNDIFTLASVVMSRDFFFSLLALKPLVRLSTPMYFPKTEIQG